MSFGITPEATLSITARATAACAGPNICTACLAPLIVTLLNRMVFGLQARLGAITAKRAVKPALKAGAKRAPASQPAAAPSAPKVKFRGRLLENEPLARYTTYRIGGPARYLLAPADADDVAKALDLADERGLPWIALGLGSNVLVKDGGFPGFVIRMGKGLDRFEMKGANSESWAIASNCSPADMLFPPIQTAVFFRSLGARVKMQPWIRSRTSPSVTPP